jgi:transposase
MGRSIGLDVHRDFCEVAVADGGRARSAGRVTTSVRDLELFAASLASDDRVVLEATGNALAIARLIEPHVGEVVLANARQLKAISHARVKTDKVDARVLADLLAAGLIPQVWTGDERVRMLRRLVSRRRGLVKRRTQVKNEISAVLLRNLKGRPPMSDPFGRQGRAWLAAQELPADERLTVDAGLRQLDFLGAELAEIDRLVAVEAQGDADVRHLLTIPGVDVTTP